MIRPGPRNLITDLDGLRVGNADDLRLRSGTTVLLPDWPMTMAVDVRGGAPGTRDTDALASGTLIERFHALVLGGGSVFGLAAADGVTGWLSAQGIGLQLGPRAVPVVPAAILFDLSNGGDKDWGEANPYPALGRAACEAAARDFPLGNVGAGMGAKAGSLKGGLGSASAFDDETGLQVGALVGANPFGEAVMPDGAFWAWALELDGELGGRAPRRIDGPLPDGFPPGPPPVSNTVIAVVATNLALDKAQAKRLAMMAQDGIARAVRPAHTPFDGDTVFAVATGTLGGEVVTPRRLAEAGAMAADCLARAIARAVLAAEPLGDKKSWRQVYG